MAWLFVFWIFDAIKCIDLIVLSDLLVLPCRSHFPGRRCGDLSASAAPRNTVFTDFPRRIIFIIIFTEMLLNQAVS